MKHSQDNGVCVCVRACVCARVHACVRLSDHISLILGLKSLRQLNMRSGMYIVWIVLTTH